MRVLGVHTMGHDTGACVFEDGHLVVSVETERLTRRKHDHRVEIALDALFSAGPIRPADIDLVAVSTNVRDRIARIPDLAAIESEVARGVTHVETTCEMLGGAKRCVVVAHEASHAALAWHHAGYADCLVLVNEGSGSFSRNAVFSAAGDSLRLVEHDALPWYGTGFGWSAMGHLFGMGMGPAIAGKVMAIGGHGAPSARAREALLAIDRRVHDADRRHQRAELDRLAGLVDLREFDARAQLIATFQELFTGEVVAYAAELMSRLGARNLALGGGCALNLDANSAIASRVAVPAIGPACNDAGQALGAAVFAQRVLLGITPRPFSPYVNGLVDPTHPADVFARYDLAARPFDPDLVARALAGGAVVAYLDGLSEIGPRALGHRSLLASPAVPGMRRRLSESLKQREWFRPLAPIMRQETFAARIAGVDSPYMLFSHRAPDRSMPEATHADGSMRVQSLTRAMNPRLHDVLARFEEMSGTPGLINTSLNARDRAIAHTADDMLGDFRARDVDLFVAGDWMAHNQERTA
jgi:carbamoyltransferase